MRNGTPCLFYSILLLSFFIGINGCIFNLSKSSFVVREEKVDGANKVVDVSRLKEGGKLAIIPFRAGAGVPATSDSEKASLMFVKGVSEVLLANNASLSIVAVTEADSADLLIKGHITSFKQPKGLRQRYFGGGQYALTMAGKMIDQKTNQDVFYFSQHLNSKDKEIDIKELGYQIGKKIGEFILGHIK